MSVRTYLNINLFYRLKGSCALLVLFIAGGLAFNLSPKPNIVIPEPTLTSLRSRIEWIPKTRSSYFGFTINLKRTSIFIGAPRAQSTLEAQREVNETGAIYKCSFDKNSTSANCEPFVFDASGTFKSDYNQNAYTHDDEKKDHQWLGASMDGNENDADKFVVCAPRMHTDYLPRYYYSTMHGICYWTANTNTSKPFDIQEISPTRSIGAQILTFPDSTQQFMFAKAEQGISVHVTDNNDEILVGAPGLFHWRGSVIRNKAVSPNGNIRQYRRSSELSSNMQKTSFIYSSDIPKTWEQVEGSYFGFAVSSGYFDGPENKTLLYVASAPQANTQQGEAYIFDIVDYNSPGVSSNEKTIEKYYTFFGKQFGEFFGYALITEDFDSDGFTDVAITAPINTKDGTYENGAVYIYRNEGAPTNFVLQSILHTDYELSGRFGTTISKVGDINQDGFNDLIVAAPFEENGAIYIYHGGVNGIASKASQRIAAPTNDIIASVPDQMFGHGLSKGVDIDGNQYLDIAVGSPNSEAVYVYKSYPVIRINATIIPLTQKIETTERSFKFNICWMFETKHSINFEVPFNATIKLDGQLGRAKFAERRNEYEITGKVTPTSQCIKKSADVTFKQAHIYKPIHIEMTYNILNSIANHHANSKDTAFCKSCVAIDPSDARIVRSKVVFVSGCKSTKCATKFHLKSSVHNVSDGVYILGSTSSMIIDYGIENLGETAYQPRMHITLPETGIAFTKVPSNCKHDVADNLNVMECDLNNGTPLLEGNKTSLRITADTTKLEGTSLKIKAKVYSVSDEQDEKYALEDIRLEEFSNVEISGDCSKNQLSLGENLGLENLTHTFEIRNNGPSNIKSLDVFLSLPISHTSSRTAEREKLIDISSVSIACMYNDQKSNVEWVFSNTTVNATEMLMPSPNVTQKDYKWHFDGKNETYRNKRDINIASDPNLPSSRTIYFDCQKSEQEQCLLAKLTVLNFKSGNLPILVSLNFTIDLRKIDKILNAGEIFVVRTAMNVSRTGKSSSTLDVKQSQPMTRISKDIVKPLPIWIYALSIIFGILTLVLLSYALYKFGFFKRSKHKKLMQLKRESRAVNLKEEN